MTFTTHQGEIYRHAQVAASSTWVIPHGLDRYPMVDVFVDTSGSLRKMIPAQVQYTDANTCTVTFSTPQTGLATVT